MSSAVREPSVWESRTVRAPAAELFALLTTTATHVAIDGTGMLQEALPSVQLSGVGDVFYMGMRHWDLGGYVKTNVVVAYEPDRLVAWAPVGDTADVPDADAVVGDPTYVWGWRFEPIDATTTKVTVFFECSEADPGLRAYIQDGQFWRFPMIQSLFNLKRLVNDVED